MGANTYNVEHDVGDSIWYINQNENGDGFCIIEWEYAVDAIIIDGEGVHYEMEGLVGYYELQDDEFWTKEEAEKALKNMEPLEFKVDDSVYIVLNDRIIEASVYYFYIEQGNKIRYKAYKINEDHSSENEFNFFRDDIGVTVFHSSQEAEAYMMNHTITGLYQTKNGEMIGYFAALGNKSFTHKEFIETTPSIINNMSDFSFSNSEDFELSLYEKKYGRENAEELKKVLSGYNITLA